MGNGASVTTSDRVATVKANLEVQADASDRVQQLQQCIVDLTEENDMVKNHIANWDAVQIKEACEGWGTNDAQLINILCSRTKTQLDRIDQVFQEKFQCSLREQIKKETSGNYAKMLLYSMMPPEEYGSEMITKACKGLGTDEQLLVEILAFRSNEEIVAIKDHWENANGMPLIDRVQEELSGDLESLVLKLLNAERDETEEADEGLAEEQATQLYEAGVGKTFGTDEDAFIDILAGASHIQIQAIKVAYESAQEMSLETAIAKEFSGDMKKALMMMVQEKVDFFCDLLKKAFEGFGTCEDDVIRVLGGNDRDFVKLVEEKYTEKFEKELADEIREELSGNFKQACLEWITPDTDPTMGLERETEQPMPESEDEEELYKLCNERLSLLLKENENCKTHVAKVDAAQIYEACKGFGTNDALLIGIMCARTKKQLDRVNEIYQEQYGKTLREQVESECSGDLKKFLVWSQMPEEEFDAHMFKKSMDGFGTDEDLLIELLTTRPNDRIARAKEFYQETFEEELEGKITGETSGCFQKILLKLLNCERDEEDEPNTEAAEFQAELLHQAGEGGWGTDEDKFVDMLGKASLAQTKEISNAYMDRYEKSLTAAIESEFSGDIEDALVALCTDPRDLFCQHLHNAFKGFGTDEETICRILAGHNKHQVFEIAERYKELYGESLSDDLRKEISGDFRSAVLTWIGVEDPTAGEEDEEEDVEQAEEDEEEEPENEEPEEEEPEPEEEPEEEPEDEGEEEEPGPDDDDEKKQRLKQQRLLKQRRVARRKKREAEKRKRQRMLQRKRKQAKLQKLEKRKRRQNKLAKTRATLGHARLVQFESEYGAIIPDLVVLGTFDEELYTALNPEVSESEFEGFEHYKQIGFNQGYCLCIKTDIGQFIGVWDSETYLNYHGLEMPDRHKPPFTPDNASFRHFKQSGFEEGLAIPIKCCIAKYLKAMFSPARYANANPSVKNFLRKPMPGQPNIKRYIRDHPEAEDCEDGPLAFYATQGIPEKHEVWVKGRKGIFNKQWYKRTYGKKCPARHYRNRGWKKKFPIKVKAPVLTPFEHYTQIGYEQGLRLRVRNPLGIFDGIFSPEGYAEENGVEDGYTSWAEEGHNEGVEACLTNVQFLGMPEVLQWPSEGEIRSSEEDAEIQFSDAEDEDDDDNDEEALEEEGEEDEDEED